VRIATLVIVVVCIWLSAIGISTMSFAAEAEQQVCDVRADYSLGVENYLEAIRLHDEVVHRHPGDALAHYHLGFALGMVGQTRAEIREYRRAEALGFATWDLFLNLGLAQIETGDLEGATNSLRRSTVLGSDHPESHFNLALVDERRGMLADAEHEISAALILDPVELDERNLLGAIYADKGDVAGAYSVWSQLVRDVPDYEPARRNLASLLSQHEIALCETNGRFILSSIGSAKGIGAERVRHCAER
jgi:Flp pilus assembly protein TadD